MTTFAEHRLQSRAQRTVASAAASPAPAHSGEAHAAAMRNRPADSLDARLARAVRQRRSPATGVLQRAVIVTVGPEIESHGPTVLADAVNKLVGLAPGNIAVSHADLMNDSLPDDRPRFDEDLYLLAHGDDPRGAGRRLTFGEQDPAQLAGILRQLLRHFGPRSQRYEGRIILEGCHAAVRRYDGQKITGTSYLEDLLAKMRTIKFFKGALESEVVVAGYLGSAFTDQVPGDVYGNVSIESHAERRGVRVPIDKHDPNSGLRPARELDTIGGIEAVVERRWGQHPVGTRKRRSRSK